MTRATIKDVSRIAGVSIKTVSRVLNKERYVSDDMRQKVEEAVARLNYHPSLAARTLAGKRSFQIGLIHDNPSPYYIFNMQAGVGQRCREANFRMIIQPCDVNSPGLIDDIGALIDQALSQVKHSAERLSVHHAPDFVSMHEKPAAALDARPRCSVLVAAELIRDGEADAMVQALFKYLEHEI